MKKQIRIVFFCTLVTFLFCSCTPQEDALNPSSISQDVVSQEVSSAISSLETSTNYLEALTQEELETAEAVARDYYANTVFHLISLSPAPNEYAIYQNAICEAKYSVGNIIVFDVVTQEDIADETKRSISIARNSEQDSWIVVNQGLGLNYIVSSSE